MHCQRETGISSTELAKGEVPFDRYKVHIMSPWLDHMV